MPPSLFMYDTTVVLLVLQVLSCLSRGLGSLFFFLLRLERLLLVPDSLYAACIPEETRFLLQCAHLSERPKLLLMSL